MVKDRLQEFKENAQIYDDGESISLVNYFAIIDMEEPFMNDFFNRIDTLRSTIDKIAKLVDDVDRLQQAMLAPQTLPQTKDKLEKTMIEIKQLGNTIRITLKQMKEIQEKNNLNKRKNIRQRIIDTQIDACMKYFCITMNKYHESVLTYREKCKLRLIRQLEIANIQRNDDEVEEILEKGRLTLFPEIIIEIQDARQTLNEMNLRHQELIELEDSIQELQNLFYDLAYVICVQGDQIKSAEDKIINTEDNIEQFNTIDHVERVSYCFPAKVSRKKLVLSLILVLPRLFTQCLGSTKLSHS
ncbi:unnamed protein product [Adineta steineri]|uniref:t-SNARE coiled-coil homology domain-containing protein n=1 Tax=Adineta steineri TaxID=433720 RepID=A0A814A1M7_9BILA|nr:unnamed protein product [Adineta steineri]CAF3702505.1 unnamed protein product [Adineta steineri]